MSLERVNNEQHLYRDMNTNAVINTDVNKYNELKRRAREKNEINKLKDEVSELKSLIKELIKKD
jgi:hypothetical protein|tara:strand:- start:236 stop:427 length:192 start_codon:yes stop_codon:yes gene_type:complete